jgi:glucose-6-phosphate isomerase
MTASSSDSDRNHPNRPNRRQCIEGLERSAADFAGRHLRDLLADPDRRQRFVLSVGPIEADFSKQRIDEATLSQLVDLAQASGFDDARRDLFAGAIVNPTENRAALHTALRGVGGDMRIAADVATQRDRLTRLAHRLRSGALLGHAALPLRTLVAIGIGGSDLGPRLVCDALRPPDAFDVRFVANVDPDDLARELAGLDPRTTAFAVVSKTFTTRETLANAQAARAWLHAGGCPKEAIPSHLIGITAAPDAAIAWGIDAGRLLEFRDWVGGRYSLWSSVGLPIAVACGPERFDELLAGAAEIDRHFRDAPAAANLPARIGMLSVWNRSFLGLPSLAVIPYAERLRLLPAYLQQLVMESNGKTATLDGGRTALATAPIVWGTSGTNAQHSFFQQLHQGPDAVPVDFIVARRSGSVANGASDDRHRILVANCLAQSAALALGRDADGPDPHRAFAGNRPSSLFVLPAVDARSLGALLACYEHATFTASVLLRINPFDQFGVEYGKALAQSVEALLAGGPADGAAAGGDGLDPGTRALAGRLIG